MNGLTLRRGFADLRRVPSNGIDGDLVGLGIDVKEDSRWTWGRLRTGWEPLVVS